MALGIFPIIFTTKALSRFSRHNRHCAYNRRSGAILMPHPDRLDREVLLITAIPIHG